MPDESPLRQMVVDPVSELAMPDVSAILAFGVLDIACLYYHIATRGREKGAHVIFEHLVLNQMIDHIERQ